MEDYNKELDIYIWGILITLMKKFLMITITVCLLAGGVNAFAYGINSFTVYDAQDNIVHKITAKSEVNALYLLFQESLQIAADEALFTELPKDAQVLYRYVLSYNYGDDEQYFSFIVYKNYPLCRSLDRKSVV